MLESVQNRVKDLAVRLTFFIIASGYIFSFEASGIDQWRILTDMRDVRDVVYADGKIWCATSGGLAGFDPGNSQWDQFTTNDGLAGIGIQRLIAEENDVLWLAFDNRNVQRFDPHRGVTHIISTIAAEGNIDRLYDLHKSKDGIFVATSRGIARITYVEDVDRWFWTVEYSRLGDFPMRDTVFTVTADGDYLWAGTANGVARGDLTSPYPLTWTNFTVDDGLAGNYIRDIVKYNNLIVAATGGGVSAWDGEHWTVFSDNSEVTTLYVVNDSLRAIISNGVYTWNDANWILSGETTDFISSAVWDNEGKMWIGLIRSTFSHGGVSTMVDDEWLNFVADGPITNSAKAFAFDSNGDMLMVGGMGGGEFGLSRWDGYSWKVWSTPQHRQAPFHYQHRSVEVDIDGGVWVGTFGGGIARYNPDSSIITFDHTEATGARLSNNRSVPGWTTTPALAMDNSGNVWVTNYDAADKNSLVCIPREFYRDNSFEGDWHYFPRSHFNSYEYLELIAIDRYGRKWLASNATQPDPDQGVYVFNDNGTLGDTTDDRSWGPIEGLNFGQVKSITWDPAGFIWVGSLDGAYYINADALNPGAQRFKQVQQLPDVQVNAIVIDPQGNKWFATNFGVTVLDPDMFLKIRENITSNPPDMLPLSTVKSLAVDPHSGWAYMGTEEGTAALFSSSRDYGKSIQAVTIEPNPFNPNDGQLIFTGSSLADNASARIFTPDGRLVRTLANREAATGWNGRDDTGNPAADGVYLIVTYSSNGRAAQGKVALIRK